MQSKLSANHRPFNWFGGRFFFYCRSGSSLSSHKRLCREVFTVKALIERTETLQLLREICRCYLYYIQIYFNSESRIYCEEVSVYFSSSLPHSTLLSLSSCLFLRHTCSSSLNAFLYFLPPAVRQLQLVTRFHIISSFQVSLISSSKGFKGDLEKFYCFECLDKGSRS